MLAMMMIKYANLKSKNLLNIVSILQTHWIMKTKKKGLCIELTQGQYDHLYNIMCSQDEIIDYLNESDDFDPQTFDNLFDNICAAKETYLSDSVRGAQFMKTITLTDDQFDTLFDRIDKIARTVIDASVEYQDSDMLEEWEDLLDVHTILEDTKEEYEKKLEKARAKQPKAEWQYDS